MPLYSVSLNIQFDMPLRVPANYEDLDNQELFKLWLDRAYHEESARPLTLEGSS